MRKVDLHNKSSKFKTVYIQKLPYSKKNMGKDWHRVKCGLVLPAATKNAF